MSKLYLIIPTKNSFSLVNELIYSLLSQTFKDWKAIFIDGNSSSNELKSLKNAFRNDERFSLINQDKKYKGIYGAMNQGLRNVYIKNWLLFWGSDDRFVDKFALEKLVKFLDILDSNDKKKINSNQMVVFNGYYFDLNNQNFVRKASFMKSQKERNILGSKQFRKELFLGKTPPHQCTAFSLHSHNINFKYSEKFTLAADLDFFLRISKSKDLSIFLLDKVLVKIGSGGISNRQNLQRFKEVYQIYKKNFKNFWFVPFLLRYFRRIVSIIYKKK